MSSERSGISASPKTLISDRNSDNSGTPRGSPHICNHESSLSFPIKRSIATLHEPPSVFDSSSILKRSPKWANTREDTPSRKRSHNNSKDVKAGNSEDDADNQKRESVDPRDDQIIDNYSSCQRDRRRSHKKKRKESERRRSIKRHSDRKSNQDENEGQNNNKETRKYGKSKVGNSPISKTLVAAYSSDDGDRSRSHNRLFPATLPRTHTVSSPIVRSERKKPLNSTSSPCATVPAPMAKVTKGTAKSTWDSSDSDFEETIAKPLMPLTVIPKASKATDSNSRAKEKSRKNRSVSLKRSCSRGRSRTASLGSASSSSCSSRRRSCSSRSYSSRRRSYSTSTSASSSSRSSSRSYSHRRHSRYHGHRRHGRHYHRRSSTHSSYSCESSSSSSRERGSRRRRRYSRSSDSCRRRSSYRSYTSRVRRGRYTSSERSRTPKSRNPSRTPPAVCRHSVNQQNSSSVVTAAGAVGSTEICLSRQLGNKSSFIRGHKPSEAVAAVASAAVRKITGRSEHSPSSTPPALPKIEEPDSKSENNAEVKSETETDFSYIGPQVPPNMAKKLGLSVVASTSSVTTSSNSSSSINANNNWKAHVGAKRKSEKTANENTKKHEEVKPDFMTPPEKDDQYKALQEQAKEHVRQQMQQAQLHASQQQQLAAAVSCVAANQTATTAPVAMLPSSVGQLSVIDQLRQRQQLCLLSGAMDQAIVLESIIRQHQQAEAVNALQQQQALQILALQQHQQNGMLAAQQHQVQSAQQAALLLAAEQHQAAASQVDNTGAAALAAQHQQAVIQTFLQQRHQQALAVAVQQQQQQQIQMLLQMKIQQQAAAYANAVAASAATAASNAAVTPAPQTINPNTNGALSGSEATVVTGTDVSGSQSPTVLAAMAAAQRNQAFHQEQLQNHINAAALVSANATGMALTQQQQQRQQFLALQAAAVAAQQQPATASQLTTSPGNLPSAMQQQIAAAALYHQQQQQQNQQQQQHAVALLLAAQQSRMLRPS